ncbi:MAG: ATP-binding protein [Candidatus Omnitrophota bacterium]|nr:ATP-binding protein [Candidatus Omnitrophota bacterium]
MPIRLKLTIMFLAVALAPLLLISFLTFNNYKDSLKDTRISYLQNLTAFKADKIETYFARLKEEIEIAQAFYNIKKNLPILIQFVREPDNPEFIAAKKILDEQLQRMQSILGLFDIMLVNPDGRIVYSSNPKHYPKDLLHLLHDPQQKAFTEGRNKVYFSDLFRNNGEGNRLGMLITAPVFDLDNAFIGEVVFEIDMESISDLMQDVSGLGNTGETLVGKKIGSEILFLNPLRHDPDAALKRRVAIGDKIGFGIQEASQGKSGTGQFIDYRGKQVIGAFRYIPSLDWGLVAKMDTDEAFVDITNLKRLVIISLIIIFVFSAIMAFSVAQSISGPIKKLTKGAEEVGRGNLDYKVGTDLKDEIGQLSRSFDKMTQDLKKVTTSRDKLDREVVERKKAEESLKRSNENLEQFAYVASHDLQEPLRMMASYSELLERRYKHKLDKDADEFISYIVDGAKRLQGLINDLLAYSRIGRIDKPANEFDCNLVLNRVLAGMAKTIEENKAIITHDNLPQLVGNENSFVHLFQNLIGNAIKFHAEETPYIHISAKKQDSEWVFSVKDNGIGIEPQYKERIFLIFQRLHARDKYSGTGIGLSICKKIIETQGGRIWVESETDKGSTFYFTVPVKEGVRYG